MKAIYKSILAAVAVAPMLTGCIEETFPNSSISQEQLEASADAVAALAWAMPGNMLTINTVSSNQHYNFGYPAMMHALDVMTDDMVVEYGGGYDWFSSWSSVRYSLGEDYMVCQFAWNFYYTQILTCNKVIAAIEPDTDDARLRLYLGAAYAYRALVYLDAASIYETLPNAVDNGLSPEGNPIIGLTIPIMTEKTTEEQARNNPRATHEEMYKFIKSDLETAISYLSDCAARPDKLLPNLAVAYGLMARLNLWNEDYPEAARYARLGINASGATPLTRDEWHNTSSGFNDASASAWMLALQYVTESDAVQTSIVNWTSFCCNEQDFGYASVGAWVSIGASFYNRMSDRDFRKLSYVAPEGSPISGQEEFVDDDFAAENFGPYYSLKFRPGSGNMLDYKVAAVVAIPLMRVEELYFIEAEATAHTTPASGNDLLKNFMKTYRYGTYTNNYTDEEDVIDEIVFQKRIELWGEGRNFFDVKRLNMSVTRAYPGSNFDPSLNSFNTEGRPGWMNFVIVSQEADNNPAIKGYNNPDPSGKYSPIKF